MQTEQVGIKPPRFEITDVLQKLGEGVEKIGMPAGRHETLAVKGRLFYDVKICILRGLWATYKCTQ